MIEVLSKADPGTLLHLIVRREDISKNRLDATPEGEFLQVSCFELAEGKTFRPHRHVPLQRQSDITQEAWIVIQGTVKAIYYDIDDTVISEQVLKAGDCTITFRGGHNYQSLDEGTLIYEVKLGPYLGQEKDRRYIGA